MKQINIVIDGSNLAYRQQFGLTINLSTSDGESTTVIFGFLRSLIKLKKEFPSAQLWVVWDGSSKNKKLAFDNYKSNREITPQKISVFEQINKLKDLLTLVDINQVFIPNEEADDVIASLVSTHLKNELNYIYSTDRDFLQLVKDGSVIILNPKKGSYEAFDEEEVSKKFGVPVELVCDYRALDGDSSDNIPRCPNLRRQIIIDLIKRYGSLDALYTSNFFGVNQKDYEKIKNFEKQAKLNLQLMRLNKSLILNEFISIGKFNADDLKSKLHQYEIFSININDLSELFTGKIPFFKTGIQAITL